MLSALLELEKPREGTYAVTSLFRSIDGQTARITSMTSTHDGQVTGEDAVLQPHDSVFVHVAKIADDRAPEGGMVHLFGDVERPGVYMLPKIGDRLTSGRLIRASGVVKIDGDVVEIHRSESGQMKMVSRLPLTPDEKVLGEDVELIDGDVVLVIAPPREAQDPQ